MGKSRELWSTVYEGAFINNDAATAKAYADDVVRYYDKGKLAEREQQRRDTRHTWVVAVSWFVGIVMVLAIIFAIVGGIYYVASNDYAGYDKKEVSGKAANAIQAWYGQNDIPDQITYVGAVHGDYLGRHAWMASYKTAAGPLCVYVWEPNNAEANDQGWALRERACS